jgi:hypothetical protein
MNEPRSPGFYFALPRLLALLRHGDSSRAEINSGEAWAGSIAVFVISYLFFAGLFPDNLDLWLTALLLVALPFLVLLFWLLALLVNAQILKLLRASGLFRSLPQRRGQAVLVGIATTAMAFPTAQRGSLSGEIAAIWLVAVALNLTAAVVLAVRHGNAVRS